MPLGFREARERSRRRWRFVLRCLKWALVAAVYGGIGYYAYQSGTALADRANLDLREQVAELSAQLDALRGERDTLQRNLAGVTQQADELRRRYAADVPTGAVAALTQLAQAKLASGVAVDRITDVLAAVENSRSCDDKPVSRRFLVRLKGRAATGNDAASFAERTITVTAVGEPAIDGEGRPLGWFEPAKPVTIAFTRIGGVEVEKTGVLPLHHSVVAKDMEHRFVVTPGERGFVQVTADSCRYP
jgi:hypothetical protein